LHTDDASEKKMKVAQERLNLPTITLPLSDLASLAAPSTSSKKGVKVKKGKKGGTDEFRPTIVHELLNVPVPDTLMLVDGANFVPSSPTATREQYLEKVREIRTVWDYLVRNHGLDRQSMQRWWFDSEVASPDLARQRMIAWMSTECVPVVRPNKRSNSCPCPLGKRPATVQAGIDVALAMHAVTEPYRKTLVLVSGDGDFDQVARHAVSENKQVFVVARKNVINAERFTAVPRTTVVTMEEVIEDAEALAKAQANAKDSSKLQTIMAVVGKVTVKNSPAAAKNSSRARKSSAAV
jgi:uncharacterized LabA/DUF88 family protein